MNILVTGGAGFIGSHFIRFILNNFSGYKVVNVDLLTYAGDLSRLEGLEGNPRYHFIQGDICDRAAMDWVLSGEAAPLFGQVDAIVHFAAESHVDKSITEPGKFAETNIGGTQVLLDMARKYKVKKFIQISTDEVYGSLGATGKFTEQTPLAPNSPYSASKAGADLLVRSYHHTYGLPACITRCSNNYGPGQHQEKLIPLLITRALNNEPLPLYGDGLQVRDWLHVEDHCSAIAMVLETGLPGEIYNIGGSNEWTNIAIANKILEILQKPKELIQFVQDRPGHDRRYAIDSSKIEAALGWTACRPFEQGLKETVEWYAKNHTRTGS